MKKAIFDWLCSLIITGDMFFVLAMLLLAVVIILMVVWKEK